MIEELNTYIVICRALTQAKFIVKQKSDALYIYDEKDVTKKDDPEDVELYTEWASYKMFRGIWLDLTSEAEKIDIHINSFKTFKQAQKYMNEYKLLSQKEMFRKLKAIE